MRISKTITTIFILILTCISLFITACEYSEDSTSLKSPIQLSSTPQSHSISSTHKPKEKSKLAITIYGNSDNLDLFFKKAIDHFSGKYELKVIPLSQNNEKAIKTLISAGEPIDIAIHTVNEMDSLINANMALDITPYLEENNNEWKNTFINKALEMGTYNKKIYAVPSFVAYPMIRADKNILDKAGVVIPTGSWDWDEFMKACATIKQKTGVYPVGISNFTACWTIRNGLLNAWSDKSQMESFISGEIPFTDATVIKVFDSVKVLYDNYVYPGNGAFITTEDQVNAAFNTGKIAMCFDFNTTSSTLITNSDIKNVQLVSWPQMGPLDYILGGCRGFMIPANTPHPKEAVEVLKYLTSSDISQVLADSGLPVTLKGIKSYDPNYLLYSKDFSKVHPKEVTSLSPAIYDIIMNKMPVSYIINGKSSLDELEKLRLQAVQGK